MRWIKTADQLPEPGKYVLARHNRGTWVDDTDQENVNCVVVKLVFGISEAQRQKIESGELAGYGKDRHLIYRAEDEHGNNHVPYNWQMFGLDDFFGQTITHWLPIPNP